MDILAKYTRKLGPRGSGGDWDGDRGVTYHAATRFGETLCGRGSPNAPRNGGASATGWELLRGRSRHDVTCSYCEREMGRESYG